MDDSAGQPAAPGDDEEARVGLADRLADIEARPLDARASAFAELHDELRRALETSDSEDR